MTTTSLGSPAVPSSSIVSCSSCQKPAFAAPWPRAQPDTRSRPGRERFPYGLLGSSIDRKVLSQAFSRDLIVLLGDRDIADKDREDDTIKQGTNRFARGLRFFALMVDEQATSLGVPLHWQLQIVHGVDHAPVPMVRAALQLLR